MYRTWTILVAASGEHGSKTGIEVTAPGRQDVFRANRDPVFRSAYLIVTPLASASLAGLLDAARATGLGTFPGDSRD